MTHRIDTHSTGKRSYTMRNKIRWLKHTYRVGQLKSGQLTILLVLECVDEIQWFFGKCDNSLARHTLWEA